MLQTTNGHYPISEAVWVLAGFIMLLAFGDVLIVLLLAVAAAAMATVWWIYRNVEHPAESGDDDLAPVTRLRPRATDQHALRGPRAA
jgi:hypothetical protein